MKWIPSRRAAPSASLIPAARLCRSAQEARLASTWTPARTGKRSVASYATRSMMAATVTSPSGR